MLLQTITTRAAQLVTAASGWTSLFTYDELTESLKVDVDYVSDMHNLLLVEEPSEDQDEVRMRILYAEELSLFSHLMLQLKCSGQYASATVVSVACSAQFA